MNLSEVSLTAILPLLCRVIKSEANASAFKDPMAVFCLDKLMFMASDEEKHRILRWRKKYSGINTRDLNARINTVIRFDNMASQIISENPGCKVINLACGFDTRFWRLGIDKDNYIDLDLPEMIALKKEILKDKLNYELIGCSVLDPSWIDKVTANGNSNFLLLAEALFYYLPKDEVVKILGEISQRFKSSRLILEIAPEKYTEGLWKKIIQLESKAWDIDVSIVSGFKDPHEIETLGNDLKVIEVTKGNVGPIVTVSIN